jgi:hypothetical protein
MRLAKTAPAMTVKSAPLLITQISEARLNGGHGGERLDEHHVGRVVAQRGRRARRPAQPQLEGLRQRRQPALQAPRVRPPGVACRSWHLTQTIGPTPSADNSHWQH